MALTVMQLTPNLDIGGAQETVRTLAKYVPRHGADVVVCSFRDGDLRSEIEAMGVPVEILPSRKHSVVAILPFIREMWRRRGELARLVDEYEVSAIQTQGLGSLDFLAMTLRTKAQVWWTIQNEAFQLRRENLTSHTWLFSVKKLAHRLLYMVGQSIVTGVIAVSPETADSFRAYAPGRGHIVVIENAVDTEAYPAPIDRTRMRSMIGIAPSDTMMITVATFKRQKGHRHLIEALSLLDAGRSGLKLVLVGDGELRPTIEKQVQDSGLSDAVEFLGSRRDVGDLLSATDLFVLPSLWEGLSVALLEAMASEIPVVATDVSGTRNLIHNGETGRLVAPGDGEALAKAIRAALDDGDRSQELVKAGRRLVESGYSADVQTARLAALFGVREPNSGSPSHGRDATR